MLFRKGTIGPHRFKKTKRKGLILGNILKSGYLNPASDSLVHQNAPIASPIPKFLLQKVWGQGLRVCISNKFPGATDATAGGETTL